jgi:hypothetical protein
VVVRDKVSIWESDGQGEEKKWFRIVNLKVDYGALIL